MCIRDRSSIDRHRYGEVLDEDIKPIRQHRHPADQGPPVRQDLREIAPPVILEASAYDLKNLERSGWLPEKQEESGIGFDDVEPDARSRFCFGAIGENPGALGARLACPLKSGPP